MIKKYRNFKTNLLSNGVLVIGFDNKDKPVNILSSTVLEEFSFMVKMVLRDEAVKASVLVSLKNSSFIAGADINEIRSMTDKNVCRELVKKVCGLFDSIENSDKTFVAAIEGSCLGGGLELALACHWRVASDHPNTTLALPEVLLGIIPGFGGTQRLPKLVGLGPALEMTTSGKTIFPKKAIRMGLVDDLVKSVPVEKRDIENVTAEPFMAVAIQRALGGKKTRKLNFLNRALGWPLVRGLVARKAKKMVLAKTDEHYPAPLKAIQAVMSGEETPRLLEVITSSLSKDLIDIFLATERMKPAKSNAISPTRDQVGVLGAGLMGSQIAAGLVQKGYDVALRDLSAEPLRKGMERILDAENKDLSRKVITPVEFDKRLLRLHPTTDLEWLRRTSFVIEAIKEVLDWKVKLLGEFEGMASSNAVFATNTSSYTLGEIAKKAKHPERCIAMHFFNPVRAMKLVEIGVADFTSQDTVAKALELSRQLGKMPIVVPDSPGFFVNRIVSRYMIEAIILRSEDVPAHDINLAAKKFGMAIDSGRTMGPLELIDYVGTETCLHVIKSLEKLGPRIENRPVFESILKKEHPMGKNNMPEAVITRRLILPMVDEVIRCLNDSIVKSPAHADLAMLYGAGFPAFTGGLTVWAKRRGLDKVRGEMEELAGKYGNRFAPCDNFKI